MANVPAFYSINEDKKPAANPRASYQLTRNVPQRARYSEA